MSHQLFGYDRAFIWKIVLQIGADGAVPVDLVWSRPIGARGAIQAAPHSLDQAVGKLTLKFVDDLAHHLARGILRFFGYHPAERHQVGYQVDIRLDTF